MHKSRLAAVVIDCKTEDLDRETAFWAGALGRAAESGDDPRNAKYRRLETPPEELCLLVQRVDHPSRVHLDIETDDIAAEVARLEGLGATTVAQLERWTVMEAPSGQRFCVVGPQRPDFAQAANSWD